MSDRTADEAVEAPAQDAPPPPSRRRGSLIGGVGLVVLLVATAVVLYMTGAADKFLGHKSAEAEKVAEAPPPAVFFDLPDLLVNLNADRPQGELLEAVGQPRAQTMPRTCRSFRR